MFLFLLVVCLIFRLSCCSAGEHSVACSCEQEAGDHDHQDLSLNSQKLVMIMAV